MFIKKMRKRLKTTITILFICFFTNSTILSEGFLAGTLIRTPKGYTAIEKLKENDLVASYCFKIRELVKGKIKKIKKVHRNSAVKLNINGKEIITSPDHKFYCPISEKKNHWVKAKDLKPNDFILCNFKECLRINNIKKLEQEFDFYCLSLDEFQNYFVSEQNILVHNFVWVLGAIKGFEITLTVSAPFICACVYAIGKKIFGGSSATPCGKFISYGRLFDEPLIHKAGKKEDNLPVNIGDFPFIPPKNKEGTIPRDKNGGYIDKSGNSWRWDPIKGEWDVLDKRNKGHRNVNPKGNETHRGTHPDSKSDTSKSKRK